MGFDDDELLKSFSLIACKRSLENLLLPLMEPLIDKARFLSRKERWLIIDLLKVKKEIVLKETSSHNF